MGGFVGEVMTFSASHKDRLDYLKVIIVTSTIEMRVLS